MRYMRSAGCQEFVVIVGHSADKVDADGATLVTNTDYENNNILHSLMYASEFMNGPVMCSYSDILVEPRIHSALAKGDGRYLSGGRQRLDTLLRQPHGPPFVGGGERLFR